MSRLSVAGRTLTSSALTGARAQPSLRNLVSALPTVGRASERASGEATPEADGGRICDGDVQADMEASITLKPWKVS